MYLTVSSLASCFASISVKCPLCLVPVIGLLNLQITWIHVPHICGLLWTPVDCAINCSAVWTVFFSSFCNVFFSPVSVLVPAPHSHVFVVNFGQPNTQVELFANLIRNDGCCGHSYCISFFRYFLCIMSLLPAAECYIAFFQHNTRLSNCNSPCFRLSIRRSIEHTDYPLFLLFLYRM